MSYDTICMYCGLVKHNDAYYKKEDYAQLKDGNLLSHGVCKSDVCSLEHAMKMSGVMDAEQKLPEENKHLLDELILTIDHLVQND